MDEFTKSVTSCDYFIHSTLPEKVMLLSPSGFKQTRLSFDSNDLREICKRNYDL